ncbi:cytochrome P450 monooxygenase [Fusarium heterosporum]|uniref:Cytochrome P450 monooxygenase n=1 Tax=Fusarium heterosporum TaxID=42747 RepID=A0A8H5SL26_FUSHE|nr:cytochrome P450 monooxygenase [Fusarium heterosporum]
MDLTAIDEDPAAVLAAVEVSAVSDQQFIFATPNRKQPLSRSSSATSTTPSTNYFTYGNISNGYRNEFRDRYHDDHDSAHDHDIPGLRTPSLFSSPSVASSLGFSTGRVSPHKRDISGQSRTSSLHDTSNNTSPSVRRSNRNSRDILAQRLSQLAHELTSGEEDLLDDSGVDILTAQLDQLEGTKLLKKSVSFSMPSTPSPRPTPRRPLSLDMYSPGDSIFGTPGSAFKTRFSDLGASIRRDPEPEPEAEPDPPPNMGMTVAQAKKVIQEVTQLNEEMSQLVANLKARQEESDHIQDLLIERAERAAQRIIFLQNRISHLEQELRENDDELQYLRICLKAVEIQMPSHPDKDLQRCISSFKKDYQALKRKRVNRSSIASLSSLGSPYPGSPA